MIHGGVTPETTLRKKRANIPLEEFHAGGLGAGASLDEYRQGHAGRPAARKSFRHADHSQKASVPI
jgi:hypothetical protein